MLINIIKTILANKTFNVSLTFNKNRGKKYIYIRNVKICTGGFSKTFKNSMSLMI